MSENFYQTLYEMLNIAKHLKIFQQFNVFDIDIVVVFKLLFILYHDGIFSYIAGKMVNNRVGDTVNVKGPHHQSKEIVNNLLSSCANFIYKMYSIV